MPNAAPEDRFITLRFAVRYCAIKKTLAAIIHVFADIPTIGADIKSENHHYTIFELLYINKIHLQSIFFKQRINK